VKLSEPLKQWTQCSIHYAHILKRQKNIVKMISKVAYDINVFNVQFMLIFLKDKKNQILVKMMSKVASDIFFQMRHMIF
jgi:hypothetical protein